MNGKKRRMKRIVALDGHKGTENELCGLKQDRKSEQHTQARQEFSASRAGVAKGLLLERCMQLEVYSHCMERESSTYRLIQHIAGFHVRTVASSEHALS